MADASRTQEATSVACRLGASLGKEFVDYAPLALASAAGDGPNAGEPGVEGSKPDPVVLKRYRKFFAVPNLECPAHVHGNYDPTGPVYAYPLRGRTCRRLSATKISHTKYRLMWYL